MKTRTWHPRGPSADAQIRALLDGSKTQLRLPIKLVQFKPSDTPGYDWCFRGTATGRPTTGTWQDFRNRELGKLSPFGAPGDLLSVRETWAEFTDELTDATQGTVCYAADSTAQWRCKPAATERRANGMSAYFPETAIKWRSPVTMPAWASRLTLLVIDVRVQRVQDISEADAVASGLLEWSDPPRVTKKYYGATKADVWETDPRKAFARLWDATWLKSGFGWDSNPWVWAANVERVAK
jgi:hypothetical protein